MSKWPILQWHFITISVIHNYGNIDTLENFLTLQAQLSKIIYTKAKDEYYYSLVLIDDYNNSQLSYKCIEITVFFHFQCPNLMRDFRSYLRSFSSNAPPK